MWLLLLLLMLLSSLMWPFAVELVVDVAAVVVVVFEKAVQLRKKNQFAQAVTLGSHVLSFYNFVCFFTVVSVQLQGEVLAAVSGNDCCGGQLRINLNLGPEL